MMYAAKIIHTGLCALVLLAGAPVRASEAPSPVQTVAGAPGRPRIDRPWIVRAELNASGKGGLLSNWNDASSVALTVGRNLTQRLAIELTYGEDRVLVGSGGTGWGRTGMANARWSVLLSASGRHALTVAGGPMVLAGGFNDTVPFAHSEAAYEYRGAFGITVLAGLGMNFALANGRAQTGDTRDCWFGCLISYKVGDLLPALRLGVGYSF